MGEAALLEPVAHREPGLAAADDQRLDFVNWHRRARDFAGSSEAVAHGQRCRKAASENVGYRRARRAAGPAAAWAIRRRNAAKPPCPAWKLRKTTHQRMP